MCLAPISSCNTFDKKFEIQICTIAPLIGLKPKTIFKTKPYTTELPLFNSFNSLIFTELLIITSSRSNFVLNQLNILYLHN